MEIEPPRQRRRWPYVVAGVVVLVIGGWFVAAGPRADAAETRHDLALAAAERSDYRSAYREARIAVALNRSPDNLIAWGSAAYFLDRNDTAAEAFADASVAGSREGTLGWLASAAHTGDSEQLAAARNALGLPRDDFERAFVAHVLLQAGTLDQLRDQFGKTAPESGPEAAARAVAMAPDDQTAALTLLQAAASGRVEVTATDPGIKRIATDMLALPDDARLKLATTVTAMQRPASDATKRLLLADRMLEFKRHRAAATLADAAVRMEPDYRDAWNILAAGQLALGETGPARRSLDISVKVDRAYGYTWYLKSQLADRIGQADEAKQFREQAERLGYRQL